MGASVLEQYDEIGHAAVIAERLGHAISLLDGREDRVEERTWLEAGRKRITDLLVGVDDLFLRLLLLPELQAFRGDHTRKLQNEAVDAVDGLLAAITALNERSPLIEVLFRNLKQSIAMRRAKNADFESYCTEFEKRLASSYASRMLKDESYASVAEPLGRVEASFAAWREALSPSPLEPEVEKALRGELQEMARVGFRVKQALLLAEAALLAEPSVREQSAVFEKLRRRSPARKTDAAHSDVSETSS